MVKRKDLKMSSKSGLQKGDNVYYARILNESYDCMPLVVHHVNEDLEYFTTIERVKKDGTGVTYLFNFSDVGKTIYTDMQDCNVYLEKMKDEVEVND